jgi:hypothetical protein
VAPSRSDIKSIDQPSRRFIKYRLHPQSHERHYDVLTSALKCSEFIDDRVLNLRACESSEKTPMCIVPYDTRPFILEPALSGAFEKCMPTHFGAYTSCQNMRVQSVCPQDHRTSALTLQCFYFYSLKRSPTPAARIVASRICPH